MISLQALNRKNGILIIKDWNKRVRSRNEFQLGTRTLKCICAVETFKFFIGFFRSDVVVPSDVLVSGSDCEPFQFIA